MKITEKQNQLFLFWALWEATKEGVVLEVNAKEEVPKFGRARLIIEIEPVQDISLYNDLEQAINKNQI